MLTLRFAHSRRQLEIGAKWLNLRPLSSTHSWWPVIRESYTGAWQENVEVSATAAIANSTVYACVSLISGDIAKLTLRLVERDDDGIWTETVNPAYSPVLRKPNPYQTIFTFVQQWITSKLLRGNTYVLKQRDRSNIVRALYILDPSRVTPLVTPTGEVYYELRRDDLSGLVNESPIVVPAKDIIHDIMCALYHPLIGVSPIFASGVAAVQGLSIQNNSTKFFANGSNPSGFLTAPGAISDETAARLKTYFEANFSGDNVGRVAVGGDGLTYEPFSMSAVDSQLIEQLKWSAETICSTFHVQPYMVGIGPPPPYANVEPLLQQYHAQCLQTLIVAMEKCLDEGLGILQPVEGRQYGTEFDIGDLLWMDTATKTKAAADSIGSGGMSPDEARNRYLNLGKVPGGDTPYMQQQYWPLKQLADREIPDGPAASSPRSQPAETDAVDGDEDADEDGDEIKAIVARFGAGLYSKVMEIHHAA